MTAYGIRHRAARLGARIRPHSARSALPQCSQKRGSACRSRRHFRFPLVYKQAAARTFCVCSTSSIARGEGAHSVILSVGEHHAAIQTAVSGFACRNKLQLCRQEVRFFDVVAFLEQLPEDFALTASFFVLSTSLRRSVA